MTEMTAQQITARTALKRLATDDAFCNAVNENPAAALAEYELSPDAIDALRADAELLAGEVSGFAVGSLERNQAIAFSSLSTPKLIGLKAGSDNRLPPGSLLCYCTER